MLIKIVKRVSILPHGLQEQNFGGMMKSAFSLHRLNHFGFTLIELMVVIVILGILAGLIVPRIVDIVGSSRQIEVRPGQGGVVVGTSLIEGRITDVIDLAAAFREAGIRVVQLSKHHA